MLESLKYIENDYENLRYGQQMMKTTFENMKQEEMNFKQIKDDEFLMINDSIDTTQQLKQNNPTDKNSSGEGKYQLNATPEQNFEVDQKTYDQLCPSFSLQHIMSNQRNSMINELDNNGNIQINLNGSMFPSSLLMNRTVFSDNRNNFQSMINPSRGLVCDTNLRKFSEDQFIMETKSGLTALLYNQSQIHNKNDHCTSLQTPINQAQNKQSKPSKFSYFFRVIAFASRLIHRNSSLRFKKMTPHQFSIIDDFSSDYEYYIYQNPHIFSQVSKLRLCGYITLILFINQYLSILQIQQKIGNLICQEIPISSQKQIIIRLHHIYNPQYLKFTIKHDHHQQILFIYYFFHYKRNNNY